METQIHSILKTPKKCHLISVFGYSTKGVPGLEINGLGNQGKLIKEKIVYLSRTRRLSLPLRRYVICVDLNHVDEKINPQDLKWLEFPILLLYWHLGKVLPISKLHDCLTSGMISTSGEVSHLAMPANLSQLLRMKLNPVQIKNLKHITAQEQASDLWSIDTAMLLECIPKINVRLYRASDSAIPTKSLKTASSLL
jgi:hypothetical protein